MKFIALILAFVALALGLYFIFWPLPVQPVSWHVLPAPGYTGVHTQNSLLTGLQVIPLGSEEGPEHVVMGRDGRLYVAVASGNILRMNADGTGQEVFASTGGRVLGFDFDAVGNFVAADALKGLLLIDQNRGVTMLVEKFLDEPIRYPNSVVVAASGKIYFSDSSTRFAPASWGGTFEASILDIIEQSSTGRILEYDPVAKTTRIVARGLSFANGVALSIDEQALFVAESGRYRVWKIAVDANDLDLASGSPLGYVLLDNLPGYPDNLMRGLEGRIWLGLVKPRSAVVDGVADKPFLRKVTMRLPRALWPVPKPSPKNLDATVTGCPICLFL
jgi:sugar lactone lactonase YvrE